MLIYIRILLVLLLSCVSTELAIDWFLVQRIFQTCKFSTVSEIVSELAQAREIKLRKERKREKKQNIDFVNGSLNNSMEPNLLEPFNIFLASYGIRSFIPCWQEPGLNPKPDESNPQLVCDSNFPTSILIFPYLGLPSGFLSSRLPTRTL